MQAIREMLTRLGVMAAHPGAFAILIVYAVLWLTFGRKSFDWHAAATLIVWFMTLLIHRRRHGRSPLRRRSLSRPGRGDRGREVLFLIELGARVSSLFPLQPRVVS